MTPARAPDERRARDRMHAVIRAAWITAAVLVGILALGYGAALVTASPKLCASCHEMRPKVDTWQTSAHNQAGCPSCHEDPRPWYGFPATLAGRATTLARDVRAHFSGEATISPTPSADATASVPDYRCYGCHDPAREVTMRYGTLIDHEEHAQRNRSCLSCHLWTAHPDPEAEKPLLLMKQCFTCHGRSGAAEAPGTCDVCHPPSFEKRPVSHAASSWKEADHGASAKSDRRQCVMCHEEDYCRDCHGLDMPHPAKWEEGKTGHGVLGQKEPRVCDTCHPASPDFCSMCHHQGYEPLKGPWIEQHPLLVEKRGAAFCMDCHDPRHCVDCHTIRGATIGTWP